MNRAPDADALLAYLWDLAEMRRMQRTAEEIEALRVRLARMRVRFVVGRLGR